MPGTLIGAGVAVPIPLQKGSLGALCRLSGGGVNYELLERDSVQNLQALVNLQFFK